MPNIKKHQDESGNPVTNRGRAPHKGGYRAQHGRSWFQKEFNGTKLIKPCGYPKHAKKTKYMVQVSNEIKSSIDIK